MTWELTDEERAAFLLVAEAVPAGGGLLEDLITEHETEHQFRRACEKLLARADSRQVMTAAEMELVYLKERIHEAKGWLKLGLTFDMWGSVVDGYAALDDGRAPPVKTWKVKVAAEVARPSPPVTRGWPKPTLRTKRKPKPKR